MLALCSVGVKGNLKIFADVTLAGQDMVTKGDLPLAHWDMTLLMVKMGSRRASATPPMRMPIRMIISGSM